MLPVTANRSSFRADGQPAAYLNGGIGFSDMGRSRRMRLNCLKPDAAVFHKPHALRGRLPFVKEFRVATSIDLRFA